MNKKGFTLIEMLMVIFIIAVLMLLIIPNITKHKDAVDEEACEAYARVVEAQVNSFELIEERVPSSISELVDNGYIESSTCSDGTPLSLSGRDVSVSQ